ncbi:TPA: helix-turn-helix transcriptional regulator [Streptococcus equi subsp. zooepidemicus]|nr:XRE family transcriptional regulator [Streptococcus satellite phage Javan193]QBX07840.1 XRE family transcriptional regulator [Streptococcus satellite phage Javan194]QBX07859.1 XRE family transcriptional regulator [Streptococcus satellite phage Javan195]HEK9955260.1 helix-turn-helix transcriptional regulator [Streptococcus equi subsp. zooepidemicus]HEK9993957.1 helix-turn-helix transcriptional regulator [Streptococcus equi subsp. zooepidemicus]
MNRLRKLRQEKKLTQQELADIAEVSKRTYIYWENGESQIKPDKVEVLADYFGITEGYLLGYTNNRFGVSQILKAIEEKMSNTDSALNKEVLESTMKIIELSDFLNMDLETLSNIYFYNLNRQKPMTVLGDLFDFFDSEARDYKELLSIVEPYQADELIQEISKLGDYREELSLYLNRVRAEEDFLQTTGYPVTMSSEPLKNVVKIEIPKDTLSDDELMALPPAERKEYISEYLDAMSKALSSLTDTIANTAEVAADVTGEQLNKLTNSMLQALTNLNNLKK